MATVSPAYMEEILDDAQVYGVLRASPNILRLFLKVVKREKLTVGRLRKKTVDGLTHD